MTSTDPPDWDTTVLDQPTVVDVPDPLPAGAEPFTVGAAKAVAAHRARDGVRAALWLARLAHAGIVAIRTDTTVYELREVLDGWQLIGCHGTPDPGDLAAAARLRARRLAAERRPPITRSGSEAGDAADGGPAGAA